MRISSRSAAPHTSAAPTPTRGAVRSGRAGRGEATAHHTQPPSTAARSTAEVGANCVTAPGSRRRNSTVSATAATTAAVTSSAGSGATCTRAERATVTVTRAPKAPTKPAAKTPSSGMLVASAGPVAPTANTTRTASAAVTPQPPAGRSNSVARTLLSANRHRAARSRTSAISASMARPHSRRRPGISATATASRASGASSADEP